MIIVITAVFVLCPSKLSLTKRAHSYSRNYVRIQQPSATLADFFCDYLIVL